MLTLLLLACSSAIIHIQPLPSTPDGHWVQLDADGKSWDCMSRPDGRSWSPVCVKVDYQSSAPASAEK